MYQVLCHHIPAGGEHHRQMLVIARCSCSFAGAYGSYFSPRTVTFLCSHQHREQRAEYTPDQCDFDRVDRYQLMSQEMKVKDF